jgi:proteasome lid subunit RPN8/RPN11
MKTGMVVSISEDLLQAILEGARRLHPKEIILLLRGKKTKDTFIVSDLLVPPLATYGHGFASIRIHMLPIDFSIIGTLHSHPSGNTTPSPADLNHSFGRILLITGYPYDGENNVAAYNHAGERLILKITKSCI